ncbi:glutamate receptor 2-like isoform X2 [Rhynchophorus ferrugineus]
MGSEMMTLLTFSQYLNSTMVPVINELDYWGDVWENWTGNGLMGNLVEDKADIGGAALYIWENMYTYLDMSKPTVRTGITCIVPAPRLAASWLIPLYAYTPTMWLVVMATILTSMLSLYLFSLIYMPHDDRNKLDKTDVFGKVFTCVSKPFIMQNVTNREMIEGKHGRIFMTLVFISALVLSTTYDSGFATIMTIPRYENPINTVEDFVSSGLYWGATQDAWILSIKDTNEIKYQTIVERFVATSETKLRELSLTGEFGFSLERLPNDNYAIGSYIKPDIIQNYHLMTEDFYWTQCVLMTRRNSILLPKLDDFVLRVFEAGLISYWQNEAASSIMDQTVQKAVKYYFHHHAKTIIKLKMAHVQGAFGILCLGYILALILFILEVIYYNLLRKTVIIHQ